MFSHNFTFSELHLFITVIISNNVGTQAEIINQNILHDHILLNVWILVTHSLTMSQASAFTVKTAELQYRIVVQREGVPTLKEFRNCVEP